MCVYIYRVIHRIEDVLLASPFKSAEYASHKAEVPVLHHPAGHPLQLP